MFSQYRKGLDHVVIALGALRDGDSVAAAKSFKKALACEDLNDALVEVTDANSEAFDKENGEDELSSALAGILAEVSEESEDEVLSEEEPEEDDESMDDIEQDDEEDEASEAASIRKLRANANAAALAAQ